MFGKVACVIAVFCFVDVHAAGGKLPDYITKCKRGPALDDCIKQNLEAVRGHLENGIPALFVPKLAPFNFPKVTLESNSYSFELTDVKMSGMSKFQTQAVKFDIGEKDFNVHMELVFPLLEVLAQYTIKGKILMLELNGHGAGRGNATNILAKIDFHGTLFDKDGKKHIESESGKVTLVWQGTTYAYFEDLFGDRKELTEATNQIIAENIGEFIAELGPITEKVVLSVVLGILKPLFEKFSLDDLFDN